jgi:hypothetical protein
MLLRVVVVMSVAAWIPALALAQQPPVGELDPRDALDAPAPFVEPVRVAPHRSEPTPIAPSPIEPAPIAPSPIEPSPIEPAPIAPSPIEPSPIEPAPIAPAPIDPAHSELAQRAHSGHIDELDGEGAPAARDTLWVFDDHAAASVPWDDHDPRTEYGPRGHFHAGAQLRVAALFGPGEMPYLEAGLVLDVRYRRRMPWHFRAVLAFSWQPETDILYTRTGSAMWLARLLPFSVDIGDHFAFRLGGQIGAQWVGSINEGGLGLAGGASGEACLRLFDGRFEVAATGGFQWSASRASFGNGGVFTWMAGAQIGYLVI